MTTFHIAELGPLVWKTGIQHYTFTLAEGGTGDCHTILFRGRMQSLNMTLKGQQFSRGFAIATKPVDWVPRVGDTIEVHQNQM